MRENVQNELKRWLKKNKIIGYSKAILITFLITGGVYQFMLKRINILIKYFSVQDF